MLNNQVNFDFSIMKKILNVAHGKLINIIGRHGNLDQYSQVWSFIPQNDHFFSKSAQKRQLLLGTVISVPFKLLPLLMAGIFALIVFATSTSKCLGKSDLINILPFFAPSISALVLVSTWFFRTLLGCSLYIFHFFHGSFLLPYLSSYLNKIYNFV